MPAQPSILTVTGTGRAARPADLARAVFSAEAVRDTAAAARAAAAETAARMIAAIRAAGIAAADLRTAGLELSPEWEPEGGRMARRGFTVVNRVAVTVRDLEAVGRVLDAGLEAGASGLDSIAFLLADETEPGDEARRSAVADARRRADTIAEAAGGRLGALIGLAEGTPVGPIPAPVGRMFALAVADGAPTPVHPGEVEVVVTVTAQWELLGATGQPAGTSRSSRPPARSAR